MNYGVDGTIKSKLYGGGKYGLLSHLVSMSFGRQLDEGKEDLEMQTATHRTNNDTHLLQGDEDSEYLSYLKKCETVFKNSRRKDYVSVQPKQEMDSLIS